MILKKEYLLGLIVFFSINPPVLAQLTNSQSAEELVPYSWFPECIQTLFIESDRIFEEKGAVAEIENLKQKRFDCEETSPVTRRIALKYLEFGDTTYDDKGAKEDHDKKELFKEGLIWSKKAINEDTLDHLNYETASMGFAAVISVSGLRGKVNMADSVRIYAEEAIRLDPKNHRAYHILGRWHYEVSKLGWFLKMLAKVLFKNSTDGSYEQAVYYFKMAVETKNTIVNRYWLGMVYLEEGDKEEALNQFKILQDIPLVQHNDQYFKDEAKKLIKKHG